MSYRKARYCLMSVLALLIPAVAPAADSISPQDDAPSISPRQTCAADFNGDGMVDVLDLIELLTGYGLCPDEQVPDWGPNDQAPEFGPNDSLNLDNRDARDDRAQSPDASDSDASDSDVPAVIDCVADLNNDGAVDALDLRNLLSDMGPCP